MSMLEVTDLSFAYDRGEQAHKVLKGIDFACESGQSVCVLGKNGAGKTTLFKCILGLLKGYRGTIKLGGEDVQKLSPREIARKVAYIPQVHRNRYNYSVFQMVLMGTNPLLHPLASPGKEEERIAEQAIESLHMTHLADRGFRNLSGGEQQLVLIARALAQQSSILILDEPAANLDFGNQHRIMQIINQLTEQGYLVVFSSHNPDHARMYTSRALLMQAGKILVYDESSVAVTAERLEQMYGVPVRLCEDGYISTIRPIEAD